MNVSCFLITTDMWTSCTTCSYRFYNSLLEYRFSVVLPYIEYKKNLSRIYWYRIAQNCGRGKFWWIWWIECHSPIFYPTKFISIFHKTQNFQIKICTCVGRDWRCKLTCEAVNLEISPSPSWSRSKIWSFGLTIFIFMITSKDTFYQKHVHCWSHDLSNYRSWVSASLNTNLFSELTLRSPR